MNPCRIVTLYSGSGGNSVYIRMADTAILIDAGKSARALCNALKAIGTDVSEIRAIFVTHDHHDHVSALEILSKKHEIPIHMTEQSATLYDRYPDSPIHHRLVRHTPFFSVEVGPLRVTSFPTPHDSRMSVGYRIECEGEALFHRVGVATDIGYVTEEIRQGLLGCEAVVLESNHDVDMLMNGPYPYDLKQRIRSKRGHLSNHDSAMLSAELAEKGTRAFLLAHLSEENNEPSLALEETERAISDPGIRILVAAPDAPTELIVPTKEEIERDRSEIYNPWNA
ncbi:MAG: MBL fold metallo-hydrolase [Clostridia bacterium]|nr:MBL fold metallo-hydrolase [Clostridia bacterium]